MSAARLDPPRFSFLIIGLTAGTKGVKRPLRSRVERLEVGGGYSLQRNLIPKASYPMQHAGRRPLYD